MRVHHFNCGTMCPYSAGLLDGKFTPLSKSRMVAHCFAIELKSGVALVDTGFGTADVATPFKRLGAGFVALTAPLLRVEDTALAQLQRRGFAVGDVRHILPTHLDLDHVGGISDFPQATVHVMAREHTAATARTTLVERGRYRRRQWSKAKFQTHEEAAGERWFGFEAVRPLPGTDDEVLMIPLYGHTRGHAGIAVRSNDGWLLHAGDAYYHHDEVHGMPPATPPALEAFQHMMQMDGPKRLHNRERLRELARSHGGEVTIVCAHDASEFDAQAAIAAE